MNTLNPRNYLFSLTVDCPYIPGSRCRTLCPAGEIKKRFEDVAERLHFIENDLTNDEVREIIHGHFERIKTFEPDNVERLDRYCHALISQL